jgi:hypothetical protein
MALTFSSPATFRKFSLSCACCLRSVVGLSGYILRARQERLTRNKQTLINDQRLLIEQTDSNKSKDYP